MAIFSFYNPSGSSYFTAETVRNGLGFYDSSSNQSAVGTYSSFVNLNRDHLVTSSYIFSIPVPNGTGSFTFDPAYSVFGTSSVYIRGTGEFTAIISTYSGSFTLTPAQMYGAGILNTFALTPIPAFQARVAADSGSYEAFECQNNVFANTPVNILQTASLLLTPNGYKEGKLYSVLPENGNGDFTVTRATTATRVNSAGLVELVPYNLVSYSNDFSSSWALVQTTKTSGQSDPFGGNNAIKLKYNTSSAYHSVTQVLSITGNNAHSVYAKAGELQFLQIASAQNVDEYANFNLGTGVIGTYGSFASNVQIENVGNGWYRCSVVLTNGSNGINFAIVQSASSNWFGISTYAGANTTDGLFLYGAQVNAGSLLPYQPTTTRLNIPRLDYSLGSCPNLLLEPQRTNLALRSEEFDNAVWLNQIGGTGVAPVRTNNAVISPSGVQNADTILFNRGAGNTSSDQSALSQNITVATTGTYYFSVWMKATTSGDVGKQVLIRCGNSAALQACTLTANWVRFETTSTVTSGSNVFQIGNRGTITTGNSVSVDLWGAQLEAGAYATSYIPTTSASVTRNVDNLSLSNVYTNNLITASGGTWFVELRNNRVFTRDNPSTGVSLSSATDGFRIKTFGTNRMQIGKVIAGSETFLYNTLTDNLKIAIKWNGATADLFVNGTKVVSATVFTATTLQTLFAEAVDVPKTINQMALFPTPLTDTQCTQLTTL